jgi:hypothetical protein
MEVGKVYGLTGRGAAAGPYRERVGCIRDGWHNGRAVGPFSPTRPVWSGKQCQGILSTWPGLILSGSLS